MIDDTGNLWIILTILTDYCQMTPEGYFRNAWWDIRCFPVLKIIFCFCFGENDSVLMKCAVGCKMILN
jgi:hypothetical protein